VIPRGGNERGRKSAIEEVHRTYMMTEIEYKIRIHGTQDAMFQKKKKKNRYKRPPSI
jgi:hypothetical protein